MLKKVLPLFFSILCLLGTEVLAQPTGIPQSGDSGVVASIGTPADPAECLQLDAQGNIISSGNACGAGGATQLTDLSDVTAKSGNSTTVTMGSGPFTSGTCAQWDANGNIVTTGSPCSAGAATTEAALEAQLTDVTDVFTNNDGALTDDDLSDNVITDLSDVTAKSGNTTVVGTVAGLFTPGDCLEIDINGNIVGTGAACTPAVHTHAAADITSGTFADARVAQSNVTQHQAALTITESQISDLVHTPVAHTHTEVDVTDLTHTSVGNCAGDTCFTGTDGDTITGNGTLLFEATTGAVGIDTGISSEIFHIGNPTKFVRWYSNNTQVRQNGHKVFSNANAGVQRICGGIGDNVANGACISFESDAAGGGTELQLASTGGSSFRVRDGAFGLKLEIDAAGVKVQDDAYGPGWNTSTVVPTKNAVYDEMETKADATHSHLEADITDLAHTTDAAALTTGVLADARVQQSNVTQHQAALSITESQISDLTHTTDTLCSTVACQVGTDDTVTMEQGLAPANTTEGRLQWDTDDNRIVVGDGVGTQTFHAGAHSTDAGDILTGTFADARISQSSVTQHQAALSITESQISDLTHTTDTNANTICTGTTTYLDGEGLCDDISTVYSPIVHNHDAADTTTGTFADARISQSSVTQHQAALSITESQISDLTHTTDTLCTTVACAVGTDDTVTLEQGTAPANVTEGRIQWDTDDDRLVVGDGVGTQTFHAGAHTVLATTEAGMETQLTDVTDLFTNNDGALTDDDLTDNVITDLSDVTAKAGNTTVIATTSGAFTSGNCLETDASGNIVDAGAACGTGGGSGANIITYYNHNFTWPAGTTTTIAPLQTETITHNVGRPPDKIVVYYIGSGGDWVESNDLWRNPTNNYYGWSQNFSGTVDEDNVTSVRIYQSENISSTSGLVRLFWYTNDPLATATNGRTDISTAAGAAIVTGSEALSGDTVDGSAVYVKRIAFGALPNTTTKNVAHGITWNEIEEYYCRAIANTGERMMMQSFPGPNARMLLDATNISIITTTDLSLYTADCTIKYTK